MQHVWRSLRYRNYRLFFGGQSLSLIGTWMQRVAIGWLVYRLTSSAVLLGLVAFAGQAPTLFLTPLGGVAADRYSKHKILIITQVLASLQAMALALLVLTEVIHVWQVIALNMVLGAINAFDMPARQAFVVQMIEKREDLGNAIALNSSMVNAARLVGPSVAGFLIAAAGEGTCFFINSISYLAVIISLLLMRLPARQKASQKVSALGQMKSGLVFAVGFSPVRYIVALIAIVSLSGMPYMVLMPIFAKDILHGGSPTLGLIMGASGVGALSGAVYLASRRTILGLGRLIAIATVVFGTALVAFSFSQTLWLSAVLIAVAGIGMMLMLASCNTVLQTVVDDEMRGRVMSFYSMAFIGAMPFGSLIAGFLAKKIGAPHTLMIGGAVSVAAGILFAMKLPLMRTAARPIYVRKGIIQEVAQSIQSSSQLTVPPED